MPFPLAHPAAVLPLGRFCPRFLCFPALIIGSLCPDLGYFMGPVCSGAFSHRLFAGTLGFDLPAGSLGLFLFYRLRPSVVSVMPGLLREAWSPLCRPPTRGSINIAVSLLIGIWTHLLLDATTHSDGWFVEHFEVLRSTVPWPGSQVFRAHEALYAVCTFTGVAWLALSYWRWMARAQDPSAPEAGVARWFCTLLSAGTILLVAESFRSLRPLPGLVFAGILTLLLVIAFAWGAERWFSRRRH